MGDKLLEKLYFGFLLLLPLVYCSSIVDPVLIPRQLLLTTFGCLIIIALFFRKKELKFNLRTPIVFAVASFLFFNWISFFQSGVVGESHSVFSKLCVLFSFFLTTTILCYNDLVRPNQLIRAVVVFGLITVSFPLFAFIQKAVAGGDILKDVNIIRGNAANKNLLSSILFLCLPFYCIGTQMGKKLKVLPLSGITLTVLVLATIRTRAVLLALLLFFALLIGYKIKQRFSIRKRYFLGSAFVLLIGIVLTYNFYVENWKANLDSSPTQTGKRYVVRLLDSKTLESRLLFWDNSMQMAKEHPILGVGMGNWQIQFPKYGLNNFTEYSIVNGESTLQRPHNDWIWILCETGILGILAYLFIFGVIFHQLFVLITKAKTNPEKWKFFFILSTLPGYLIISFFDFPYERIEHQVILMLLFALVSSAYLKVVPHTPKNVKSLLPLLLIPIGYSFLVSYYRFNGERHAVKMYVAKNDKNWSETVYEAKKADNYFYRLDNTTLPLSWYEGIGHFNEGRLEESEACFERAYHLTPYNIQVITNLAGANQANGKIDEAAALFGKALQISRNFDEAKLSLAALYFNKKEFDKAFATINEVSVTAKNPKYTAYLVPILNQKINAYLKTATNKVVVDKLIKNVTTKEALLQLFFDAKKHNIDFETYLAKAQF